MILRAGNASAPMTEFDPTDPGEPAGPQGGRAAFAERPPSVIWRFAGALAAIPLSVFTLLSLVSYDAADIAFLHAPPSAVCLNWMGRAGAHLAWGLLMLFGLPALLVPAFGGILGWMMVTGRHVRWRPLWALLLLLNVCALFQFLNGPLAAHLASESLNLAPNAGGGMGCLLNHDAMPVNRWIGPAGSAVLNAGLAALWLLLFIGPRSLARRWAESRERRRALLEAAEDRAIDGRSELEADDASLLRARAAKRDRRAEEAARREEERETAASEKERLRAEKEAERDRRRAEREAEKAREKEERRAEKERRRAEKEAARAAKRAGRGGDDEIFAGGGDAGRPADEPSPGPLFDGSRREARPAAAAPETRPAPAPTAVPSPRELSRAAADDDEDAFSMHGATFRLPSTSLLHPLPPETAEDNRAEVETRSRIIEDTLAEFGLPGAVTRVVCGPTITRYEVKPAQGVKVDRIQSVHSNLQMNLKAKSLRIIAPIPGKDVVGLEVPNVKSRSVPLRGIAESPEWKAAVRRMALPMLLSRDIDGAPVIADLAKMPHLIVAGTTGSGKSVTLNGILSGWLLSRTPEQLRLVLVDPKRIEFTPYADIPHLVVPVITEAPKVAVCLQWAVKEMDRRLKLFQKVGVRNIASFNERPPERQASLFGDEPDDAGVPASLPYVVVVIDEMSDLMMLAGADVEPRVVRLAQLARAVGIHLIIATQRPDVKVITGKIKANFPARIALKVASAMDSMTIIDQGGAQTLIGRGDMLFLNPTSSAGLQRSQSCWIDDEEIAALTQWYRDQSGPLYLPDIAAKLDRIKVKDAGDEFKTFESDEGGGAGAEDGGDAEAGGEEALLQKCLDVIVAADRASTSMLQRKLRLGYNKAARIMDELEQRGCIGPANGSAPRDILRTTLRDPSAPASDDGAPPSGDDF